MNVLDLFSGIGGFSLGLERAGMHTVAFCERDEFCRAVLRKHWPHVPSFDDVRTLDASRLGGLGRIDLVCGGFPCQPFSHASRTRQGQNDDRYLWPAMREVIALARPTWVIGENVTGIVSLALDDVLADLESLGYAPRPFVIPACAVGAHHRRSRVWIVARDTHGKSESARALNEEMAQLRSFTAYADSPELRDEPRRSSGPSGQGSSVSGDDGASEPLANPDRELRGHRYNGAVQDWRARPQGDEGRRNAVPDQGHWDVESGLDRVAYGVPNRVDRLRALGNAVVPQVVEEIGRAIMQVNAT